MRKNKPDDLKNSKPTGGLGFIPVPVLVLLIVFFRYVLKSPAFYDPGWLISITNTLFIAVVCFAVAFIAMRNYRLTGRLQILLLGCGVLSFGIGGVIAGFVRGLPGGANLNVTIYNTGALAGALFHFIAALILISGISPEIGSRQKGIWLAAGDLGVIIFMAALTLASVWGVIPPFFIQDQGPTPLRQGILGTADALFVFSFLVFLAMYVRNREIFLYWYSLALSLTSISLTAFLIESSVGNLTSWTGRTAQYIGGIYFLIAIRSAMGGAKARKTTFDNIITASLSPPVGIREVLESITDGFFFLDRTWNFTYVNKKTASFWGRTPSELLGKNIWQMVPQAVGTIFYDQYHKALSEQRPVSFEAVSPIRGDWVEVRTYPSKDGLSVYFNDISERKRAEEALRSSEERLRLAQFSASVGVWDWHVKSNEVTWTPELEAIFGLEPGTVRSYDDFSRRVHPDDVAATEAERDAAVRNHQPFDLEFRIIHSSGQVRWISSKGRGFYDEAGEPVRVLGNNIDITERKRAEEALELAARFARENPNPVMRLDQGHVIEFANAPALQLLKSIGSDIGADAPAEIAEPAVAALKSAAPRQIEKTYGGRAYLFNLAPIPQLGYVNVYATDITERKQAEQALRESERRERARVAELETLMEVAPVGIFRSDDNECRRMFGNSEAYRQLRRPRGANLSKSGPEEEKPVNFRALKDGKEIPLAELPMQKSAATGQAVRNYELEYVFEDGETVTVLGNVAPLLDESGRPRGALGTFLDVTAGKRAEEALRESEERLRMQMERMPIGCIVFDRHNCFSQLNPAAERILGYSAAELRGRHAMVIVPETERPHIDNVMRRLAEGDMTAHSENENVTKDGRVVMCQWTNTPLRDGAGNFIGFLSMVQDITEHKRAEEERQVSVEFLRIVNASTGIHDLVKATATFFQEQSGCQAVGIRLRDGEDYPYYQARGFPKQFVLRENSLCARNAAGEVIRDTGGYPIHECMCGNVICGRFDPAKPFFTAHGSFWTNCTTELLASTTEPDRQSRTRNRCNGEGYESVALIPLQAGQERLGLLQLNDRRKGQFSVESITLWERLAGYLGVALARTMAQEALRESEAQFRTLANAIPQLCWMANADGWLFWYNDRWYQYTGTTPEQMDGWGWQSVHDPEALPKVLERWRASIATRQPFDMVFPLRGADGVFRPFLTRVMPVLDGEGKVVRWFGTNTDVTEQRRAEEKLRESEERLRIAVEAAELGTWDLDLIHDITVRSLRHDQIWGYTQAQPKWSLEIAMKNVAPEDRQSIMEAYERGIKSGVLSHENRVIWPDGSIHWISANGRFQYDDNGRPIRVVGVVADITERKAFQAELQRLVNERTAKLKELVGDLEHFSYTITHDMRAPLRGMHGFSALMAEECQGCERKDATDFLRRIQTSALRMDALITDALNYSKVVRHELELTPVDVGALLRGMLDSYPELQPEKAQIEIAGELPLVMGNEAGLTQVLSNLLGNAIKFVKPGQKPEIRVWAEVRKEAEHRNGEGQPVRLWVEDKGIGIPDSMKPKLFELFSRGHRDYEGTGVGLALVRKVVERMGGKVGVDSQEGRGSRFWVELKPGELRVKLA